MINLLFIFRRAERSKIRLILLTFGSGPCKAPLKLWLNLALVVLFKVVSSFSYSDIVTTKLACINDMIFMITFSFRILNFSKNDAFSP